VAEDARRSKWSRRWPQGRRTGCGVFSHRDAGALGCTLCTQFVFQFGPFSFRTVTFRRIVKL
jgi:hypothetical protein